MSGGWLSARATHAHKQNATSAVNFFIDFIVAALARVRVA